MDKPTRAENAFFGRPVDRPPVCFWHNFKGLTGQDMVAAHMKFYRESGIDILKMMCDEFFVYPLDVSIEKASDWRKLRPLGKDHPYIREQVERATQINEALKGDTWTLYNAFSPYTTLKHTVGDELLTAHIREDGDAVMQALDVVAEDTCAMIEGVLTESGTRGIMLALQGAEKGHFPAEDYIRKIHPSELRVVTCADGLSNMNLLHMCGFGGKPNQLSLWEDYPARCVSWAVFIEGIDMAEGRSRFPGRSLMGGFDSRAGKLLHRGSKEKIMAETRAIVRKAGKDGIIIGADCSLPADIDYEHIRSVVEALESEI